MGLTQRWHRWLVLVFACALPSAASATEWRGEVEFALGQTEARWAFAPLLRAGYGLDARWRLRADWGCVESAQGSAGAHGWSQFYAGNLLLGAEAHGPAKGVRWGLGAEVVVPLTSFAGNPDPHTRTALGDASALQGLWDLWVWAPSRMGLVVPGVVGLRGSWYRLELEGAAGLLVPLRPAVGSGVDVLGQVRLIGSLRSSEAFEVGGQLQAVLVATQPRDQGQTAVAPFARMRLGSFGPPGQGTAIDLGARVLLPVDAPLTGRWSFHVSLSLRGADATDL